jgi:hypothetical protein
MKTTLQITSAARNGTNPPRHFGSAQCIAFGNPSKEKNTGAEYKRGIVIEKAREYKDVLVNYIITPSIPLRWRGARSAGRFIRHAFATLSSFTTLSSLTPYSIQTSIILLLLSINATAQNNVGIGTTTPNSKAILELKATDKGFIAPRLTTMQMLAIAPTATESALLVYNTDSACYHFYNGTTWKNLCQKQGLDSAAINKLIKNYLNSNATTIINILKGDTALFNYTTINQANINILTVDTSITNVAIINNATINILKADTSILNYANINNAVIDSSKTNYADINILKADTANINVLNVGGQNIMQTISDSIKSQAWLLKGNIATNAYKLGTLNARDLHIVANNLERITIANGTGNVGIGQTLPSQKLDIIGNQTTTGFVEFYKDLKPAGLPGNNADILTSTGAGTAPVWKPISTILNSNTTTIMNVVNIDSSTTNYANINNAVIDSSVTNVATINILKADTSILNYANINNATIDSSTTNYAYINNANVNILKADTSILNYANINNATIDSSKTNYADINILKGDSATFNYLSVDGQNIMQTMSDSIKSQAWLLKGNNASATNFLGTTNNQDLIFKRNNQRAGLISDVPQNTSFGYLALNPATTGVRNTAIGWNALRDNTTGSFNTGIGAWSLISNTTGDGNTALGYYSLPLNTTGVNNTGVGASSLANNLSGANNTAMGTLSLANNTTAANNTAVGASSLGQNVSGYNNTAVGYKALPLLTSGNWNVATGYFSMSSLTTGDNNVATGVQALPNTTTGSHNVAVGDLTGITNATGSFNTYLGATADATTNNLTKATAIGYNAKVGASNTMVLGGTGADAVNVGIGTTTPSARLFVKGSPSLTSGAQIQADANYLTDISNTTSYYGTLATLNNTPNAPTATSGVFFMGAVGQLQGNGGTTRTFGALGIKGYNGITTSNCGIYADIQGQAASTENVVAGGYFSNANTSGNQWALYESGRTFSSTGVWTASDRAFKKDIVPIQSALGNIAKLKLYTYYFNTEHKYAKDLGLVACPEKQYGVIAQELQEIFPDMVTTDGYGNKLVKYDALLPVALKAIQEQQAQIQLLLKRIETLEKK